MAIRTFNNFRCGHERFEGLKNVFETLVVQLTTELLEFRFLPLSPVGYMCQLISILSENGTK
jgi:hypothetical protein